MFFSHEIESFYYTSRRKLLETIKNNINHSNLDKLSFGDKFIWLLNSESKDTLICMCDFLLKSHCFAVGQPAWQESSKVKSRDFRFIFDEKWRSTLRLKYVGLQ